MDISLPKSRTSGYETYSINSDIVIIGANGSGKSRFGHFIDQINQSITYRIAARKYLNVPSSSALRSLAKNDQAINRKLKQGGISSMQDAYSEVIDSLFAEQINYNQTYIDDIKNNVDNYQIEPVHSKIDILENIWKQVMPHRKLSLKTLTINVETTEGISYNANEMSDGEKIILYLIGQCLLIPDNSILIIDEPEIHINKAILVNLWNQIEYHKPRCLFIYITHDLDFALSRNNSQKIWVKSYNKNSTNHSQIWDWEFLSQNDNIPEELELKLLGNRKPILFVEGVRNKFSGINSLYFCIFTL